PLLDPPPHLVRHQVTDRYALVDAAADVRRREVDPGDGDDGMGERGFGVRCRSRAGNDGKPGESRYFVRLTPAVEFPHLVHPYQEKELRVGPPPAHLAQRIDGVRRALAA